MPGLLIFFPEKCVVCMYVCMYVCMVEQRIVQKFLFCGFVKKHINSTPDGYSATTALISGNFYNHF